MTYYDRIRKLCDENHGVITSAIAGENEIPSWYLSDMTGKGELIRAGRGIYMRSEGDYDEYYFFQLQNKRCIYSFSSALYLHGMTDRIPFQKEVTVYKGYNSSHITDGTIIHYVSKEIYETGIGIKETNYGNPVSVYDKERTICDLIKYRRDIDVEIFTNAVRMYSSRADRDYRKLRKYAGLLGVTDQVNDILEVI